MHAYRTVYDDYGLHIPHERYTFTLSAVLNTRMYTPIDGTLFHRLLASSVLELTGKLQLVCNLLHRSRFVV